MFLLTDSGKSESENPPRRSALCYCKARFVRSSAHFWNDNTFVCLQLTVRSQPPLQADNSIKSLEKGMDSHLLVSTDGSVRYLTLNNVARANSMSKAMVDSLVSNMKSADQDENIIAVVLAASGKFFCTGMDFSASEQPIGQRSSNEQELKYQEAADLFESISTCSKTTIVLVNGPCYGGGNGLVFACDIRVALSSAKFVLSEVRRGLSPATISRYVVREWGTSLAREAIITGRKVTPEELRNVHAIHHIVDDMTSGRDLVRSLLETTRKCAPRAVAQSKRLVNAIYEEEQAASDKVIKEVFIDMIRPSDEAAHGIAQFQAGKRDVDWESYHRLRRKSKF